MESILAIIQYTVKQHIRHRVYLSVLLFGLLLIGSGLIVSTLALEEQVRMVLDIGLSGIEFLALLAVVFLSVNLIIEEMENRSLYLVLSHPIPRWHYIVGRFAGTMLALIAGIGVMALMHLAALFLKGWQWNVVYGVAVLCSILKIMMVGSLALLLSLITTSTATSMALTVFLWILGHFTQEMVFMAEKSLNPLVKVLVWMIKNVTPNFSYFNYRDFWRAAVAPPGSWWVWLFVYSGCYIAVALVFTSWFFSKREF